MASGALGAATGALLGQARLWAARLRVFHVLDGKAASGDRLDAWLVLEKFEPFF